MRQGGLQEKNMTRLRRRRGGYGSQNSQPNPRQLCTTMTNNEMELPKKSLDPPPFCPLSLSTPLCGGLLPSHRSHCHKQRQSPPDSALENSNNKAQQGQICNTSDNDNDDDDDDNVDDDDDLSDYGDDVW